MVTPTPVGRSGFEPAPDPATRRALLDLRRMIDNITSGPPIQRTDRTESINPALLPPFYFIKVADVIDIPDTYTPVAALAVAYLPEALYFVGVSITYTFPSANRSVYFRWRTNGGPWNEWIHEAPDAQDRVPIVYGFPRYYGPQENFTLEFEARKAPGIAQFDIKYLDLWLDLKGPPA
ncbi:MAG TPA: hypothetical protein VMW08_11795 [Acidimicrobiales bacterium]|nr:hypothetical protein [Acidimicrobiales bacterium]